MPDVVAFQMESSKTEMLDFLHKFLANHPDKIKPYVVDLKVCESFLSACILMYCYTHRDTCF